VDELLYRQGSLDQSMPLPELRKIGHINTRAQNARVTRILEIDTVAS